MIHISKVCDGTHNTGCEGSHDSSSVMTSQMNIDDYSCDIDMK